MPNLLIISKASFSTIRMKLFLRLSECSVKHVKSLCEAWVVLGQETFDGILVDSFLDEGTGIDFCSSIRYRAKSASLIVLGTEEDKDKIMRGKLTGVSDFLQKPFSNHTLKTVLNRNLFRKLDGREPGELRLNGLYSRGPLLPVIQKMLEDRRRISKSFVRES